MMRMHRVTQLVFVILVAFVAFTVNVRASDGDKALLTDATDGNLDLSNWLIDRKGFLPVPIIITEPALGFGGGAALLFFRQSMRETTTHDRQGGRIAPPDVFGIAVAATENGTKAVGAGGRFSFDEDRWRYRGALGRVDINLDFYGTGNTTGLTGQKLGYNLDGWMSSQQILRRLGDSDNFAGLRWIYFDLDNQFDFPALGPVLPAYSRVMRSSGLGLSLEHDSRDNIFTPSRGLTGSIDAVFYSPELGGDNQYQSYRGHVFAYMPMAKSLVLGGRIDGRAANGDVPFYQLPFIDMRGIPAARYQDTRTAVAETEMRWNVTARWAFIGFAGIGRAWGIRSAYADSESVVSKGAGVRYLIARRLGLYMGADFAWGPEDRVFYIQVGSAWR
jgi:hypothetical protein